MTDKTKKILLIALSALVVALAVALVIVLIQPGTQGSTADTSAKPEHGTYYFDAGSQEYTLTLNTGNRFTLYIKGGTEAGAYTLTDKDLSLDFDAEGVETITASMENEVVTLTFNGATMRFLKKVTYTVNYEVNGGQAMEAVTVLNGKTVAKPADPARDGFVFIGWYADSEFKTPFAFNADPVTADMTLYARWSEALGGGEYTVDFDANYAEAEAIEAMTTTGGKLFALPTLTREGYEFKGWWISMTNNGEQLTRAYTEGTLLDGNTTLYALWQENVSGNKLTAPVVNITAGALTWNSVPGARGYSVTVIDETGYAVINNESTSATTYTVPFDTLEAGKYEIRVVALSNTGDADNAESVRYFINRALGQVNNIVVIDSMLVFNTVEHAEKYLITVVCGNAEHNHTNFDNGTSRTFNFANCDMTADGIRFTITAVAEGYGSTTSREFVYRRDLNTVEGLRYDEATQTVIWNEVPNAANYMVSVQCGNAAHNHAFVNNGSQTFVSLKGCDACEGGIVVKVYPKTRGFNSPAASELVVNKTGLATPSDIRINGTVISWAAVNGAAKYEVQIGSSTHETTETSLDLANLVNWIEGNDYTVSVRAAGDNSSLWSDALTVRYAELNAQLRYQQNTLYWMPVVGATGYEIQINDGDIISIADGASSAKIVLTQAGTNVLKVRYMEGSTYSEWVSMEVYAHTVTFDTRGGTQVPVQYLAVGDLVELPTSTKSGYQFAAWYNVPGGPAANGKAYTDELYAESGSIVLYAHYTPNKYTITYNYGVGGTGDKISDQVAYESHYQLTVPAAKETTSAFGGWYSSPYGMGVQYTDSKGNSLNPWNAEEGATVYAFWIEDALKFTLTKVNGVDSYMVSAGPQIALVSEITIPETYNGLPVAMIAGNAFKDCTNLLVINMPNSIQTISAISPFEGCSRLEEFNVYPVEGIVTPRFWSKDGVLFDNGTTVASLAQAKMMLLPLAKTGVFEVPEGVVEIPERAFANSQLTRVVIAGSVTKIGFEAFADSAKLTTVFFETSAENKPLTILGRAFANCIALERITLPARLADINLTKYVARNGEVTTKDINNAFVGCHVLKSISVARGTDNKYISVNGVVYSGDGKTLLYCPNTIKGAFSVPAGTVAIADGAFIGCTEITEVILPNSLTLVGEYAFYDLRGTLTKVTFAGNGFNAVVINKYAFANCDALAELVFEPGSQVSILEAGAFQGCSSLAKLTIPSSMTKVGYEAFKGCSSLAEIEFMASNKKLAFGEGVFMDCTALTTVNLPANVSEMPGIFGGCTSLEQVNVAEDSEYLISIEGVVFNKAKTEILFFPCGKSGEYTLPDTVTTISSGVFANVEKLTKLVISNAVSYIGESAFAKSVISEIVFEGGEAAEALVVGSRAFNGAKIGTMELPAHTTEIRDSAFSQAKFTTITLNEGIVSLGNYAFYAFNYSEQLQVPTTVKSIGEYCFAKGADMDDKNRSVNAVLPTENAQLETIGKSAFRGNTKIKNITIPASVTTIGSHAFAECTVLATVDFAEGSVLKVIDGHTFDGCTKLASITIPKSVTSIKAMAFYYCTGLVTVNFEEGGTENLIIGEPFENIRQGLDDAIIRETHLGEVFSYCNKLATVNFPERLLEIAPKSFYMAAASSKEGLTVNFGENSRLAVIGEEAFYMASLNGIVIPNSVRNLDPYVNDSLNVSYDRLGIGANAFAGNFDSLDSVVFQAGGTEPLTIGAYAFRNADLLTSIEFPARLAPYTSLSGEVLSPFANGADIFYDAENLKTITIEDGGQYYVDINGVVFTADHSELIICPAGFVGSVEVPAATIRIHDRAFLNCVNLEALTFVGGTEPMTVGDEAFKGCSKLTTLTLPDNASTLGKSAFAKSTALQTLHLGKNVENFDAAMVTDCPSIQAIYVTEGSEFLFSDNGVLYNGDKSVLICYPISRETTVYTVQDTVKVIGSSAFLENTSIQEVVLPAGLIEIRAHAFDYCSNLKTVHIPNTVTLIDESAFYHCSYLSELTFEMGGTDKMIIGKNAFAYTATRNLKLPATVTVLGNYAFYQSSLQNLTFEENSQLFSIADLVFQGTGLVSVTFPAGLNTIGDSVFLKCYSLKNVVFGEGLVTIGDQVFKDSSVETVAFPASLKNMGVETFMECADLREVTFAPFAQLTYIPTATFAMSGLEWFTVPAGVQEIKDADKHYNGAFYQCTNLVSVNFAEGSLCKVIGSYAFYECTGMVEFDIPATVTTLGESAFENCESLESIIIPANTTNLGSGVFSSCFSLSKVTLNTKATALPGWMFANCHELTEIVIPETVSSIGDYCFTNGGLADVAVEAGNPFFAVKDGVLYTADFSTIVLYPEKRAESTLVVPNTVTSVKRNTFGGARLTEIIFLDGEKPLVIEESAFARMTSLIKVQLPSRLVSIGENAFENCENLMSINIPAKMTINTIGDDAFYGCDKLYEICNESQLVLTAGKPDYGYLAASALNIYTPTTGESMIHTDENGFITMTDTTGGTPVVKLVGYCGTETVVTIPAGVTVVHNTAFAETEITKVIIPEGVIGIGSGAFSNCDYLTEVSLPSTLQYISDEAFYYCKALIKVEVPASVQTIGYYAFRYCTKAQLYMGHAEQPASGWDENWTDCTNIIWGFDGVSHTYSFESNGGSAVAPVEGVYAVALPAPTKEGYVFVGWYDNAALEGNKVAKNYYNSGNVTLYAKWMTQEEFNATNGATFDSAIEIELGEHYTMTFVEPGQKFYMHIVSAESQNYKIYAEANGLKVDVTHHDSKSQPTSTEKMYNNGTSLELDEQGDDFYCIGGWHNILELFMHDGVSTGTIEVWVEAA